MRRRPLVSPRLVLLALAALATVLVARHAVAQGARPASVAHPAWTRSAVLYEVNLRQHTAEGTIAAFRRELPALRALGVDALWIMPVQPIGRANRKGGLGSYYSIADYTAVNPEFGTLDDFKAMVADAHALGMKVILDWVANHTAFDHRWTREHPDWYVRRADGSISVAIDDTGKETDWTDVAQLDYRRPAMRQAMIDAMRWWVEGTGIDGFRCDVAFFLPDDFWRDARAQLERVRPELFLLAEAELPRMHATFDMTYWWTLHHLANKLAKGTADFAALDSLLASERDRYPADAIRMAFTSSHDENSWNGSEFERMGANHAPAFVLMTTLRGTMPMLYSGQEGGNRKRLRFFDKDTLEVADPALATFYRRTFALKHANPALRAGDAGGVQRRLALSGPGTGRAYAFTRTLGANVVVVAVNMHDAPVAVRYDGLARTGRYSDWYAGTAMQLGASGTFEIPANGWRVFVRGARAAR